MDHSLLRMRHLVCQVGYCKHSEHTCQGGDSSCDPDVQGLIKHQHTRPSEKSKESDYTPGREGRKFMPHMRIISTDVKFFSMCIEPDKRKNKLDAKKYAKHNSDKPKHLVWCCKCLPPLIELKESEKHNNILCIQFNGRDTRVVIDFRPKAGDPLQADADGDSHGEEEK